MSEQPYDIIRDALSAIGRSFAQGQTVPDIETRIAAATRDLYNNLARNGNFKTTPDQRQNLEMIEAAHRNATRFPAAFGTPERNFQDGKNAAYEEIILLLKGGLL